MVFLFIYSTHILSSVLKIMTLNINYKNVLPEKNSANLVLFIEENLNISSLKKYISNSELSYISDLIKKSNNKKKITAYDINSKRKITLVSIKKKLKSSQVESLGGKFYDYFKDTEEKLFDINTDSIASKSKDLIGYFLHGL